MNDRIQELLKQSYVMEPYYPAGNDGHPEYRTYISQEKFAELIVRECATVITETRWRLPPTQQQIAVGIKEHFGVNK